MKQSGTTGAGKALVTVVVLGLIGGGVYLLRDQLFPKRSGDTAGPVDPGQLSPSSGQVEAADSAGITTVQEYSFVPAETLPPVEGVSKYEWDETEKVVNFPINVWIGWLPIIAANHGAEPNTDSVFLKQHGFKLRLTLIDNPVDARAAFASGKSHILWGTLDMMVLFAPELMKDSRTAPRIFQQVDWSAGGDGIVVRGGVTTVADLKGKTVVFAQNSPSEYYLYNLLVRSGLQPTDIKPKYTEDAFQAAAAFVADSSIDACVSWAPDIYRISDEVAGTRLLSSTADANRVIADVWAARADFAKDHPEVLAGLVEGIFEGMRFINASEANKQQAIGWLADFYGFPVDEVAGMTADAYATGFGENLNFFLNRNNPTNFENTWNSISYVYKTLGKIKSTVPFEQVMDFGVLQKLRDAGKFQDQRDISRSSFVATTYSELAEARDPLVAQAIRIHFYPNSSNLNEKAKDATGKDIPGQLYDPQVKDKLQRAAQLAGQFEAATVAVTGHCDDSLRGLANFSDVQRLSQARAQAVVDALVAQFKFPKEKFTAQGMAWDQPANPEDPQNHALNRRVEIRVFPAEAPE